MSRETEQRAGARRPPAFVWFGGSFNPVHRGHVDLVRGLLAGGGVDHVLVVPAARSPFKDDPELLPAALRYDMVRRALQGIARSSVLDLELRRPPPSYTAETLADLQSLCPAASFRLAMGLDAFRGFAGWYRGAELLARAGLLLVDRPGEPAGPPADPEAWRPFLPEPWRSRLTATPAGALADGTGRVVVERREVPTAACSSTHVRDTGDLEGIPSPAREALLTWCRGREAPAGAPRWAARWMQPAGGSR